MKSYWVVSTFLFVRLAAAQAPVLTSLSPVRNAVAADRAANVVLNFSRTLNSPTPGAALRVFSSQRGGRLAGTLTTGGATLTFDPARDFVVGEQVSVIATTNIQGSNGTALANPQVYQFRVRPVGGTGAMTSLAPVPVGNTPFSVATADVDGDGDLDLLTANQADNTVSVRLNNGQGVYSGGSTVAVGSAPTDLDVADLDGDGDLDLLTANQNNARVSVRFNDGSGTFAGGSEVAVGTEPVAVVTADLDGDGDLDLLAATDGSPAKVISLRLNNGSGAFSGGTDIGTSALLRDLAAADIDNDGDLDVLATDGSFYADGIGRVVVLRNDGAGGFTRLANALVYNASQELALGDVDNDGDVDLLAANNATVASNPDYRVSVRLNNGAGVFSGSTELSLGRLGGQAVTLADVDSDGDLDVFAGYGTRLNVFLNLGAGVFGPATSYLAAGLGHIAAADVDGDGDLDAVAVVAAGAQVWLNNGQGSPLAARSPLAAGQLAAWPNPARSQVQLTGVVANQPVLLLDLTGRILAQQPTDAAGNMVLELPATLPAGTYLLKSTGRSCLLRVEL